MLRLFEERARHRMAMEREREHRDARRADLGLAAGTVVTLSVLGTAAYCATIGQPWVAGVLGGLDIVALAAIFIHVAERRRSERTEQLRWIRDARAQLPPRSEETNVREDAAPSL